MAKGFTLLEILVALLILSVTALMTLPVWQRSNEQMILVKEQHKLQLFLRKIQSRAENSSDIWFIVANRDLAQQQWCLTAQIKHTQICDCLNPNTCPNEVSAQYYYPYFADKTMLISKKYFPQELSRFNGMRDTLSTICFVLQAGSSRSVFSLFNVGSVKLKDYQSQSACVSG
ncbi:type II secretion system protein [Conservatibacter flavescens]|uniref:Prepilin-type cleavage/methylation domain-containing protein n=1 Tax=Conservatibacter flavescens TaxID=28161 RepID=A0A2M8S0D6_9PAST|nr:type II secretion system protein [Conservatibacter flavescens]PJG84610.1 prepilin-type cleavage/methylation domain-containing protein [Conservatibacter flavescens]